MTMGTPKLCITGGHFNIKMSSYQYRKSHCGDKTVVRSSYLHNGISYTGKLTSLYWIRPLASCEGNPPFTCGFPSQRDSNVENITISWHHHMKMQSKNYRPFLRPQCVILRPGVVQYNGAMIGPLGSDFMMTFNPPPQATWPSWRQSYNNLPQPCLWVLLMITPSASYWFFWMYILFFNSLPDSKVHGANMGPIWGQQDPGGPHVGPMNLAIWVASILQTIFSDAFSLMKNFVFWLKFHWSLFLRV